MQWVDELQAATGWQGPRYETKWTVTEAELGVALPADYKEMVTRFGPGQFSSFFNVLLDDNGGTDSLLSLWRRLRSDRDRNPSLVAHVFDRYDVYLPGGKGGLIPWGGSERGNHYWLADDSSDSAEWPIVVQRDDFLKYDMSTAEFMYRVIADSKFKPITIADPAWPPTFHPKGK